MDIETAAGKAAPRDRPELYDDDLIADFTALDSSELEKLESYDVNTLLPVAALGYHHIGAEAFLTAFELMADISLGGLQHQRRFSFR